ncbi:M20 family metallopeptidase [Acidaminobacter sp. JC074]|uniref:M20/M25/M40 family metallo-hydrolase n=1 Tax=Acidaminobacter sp. JC074 TaxID=2530199 RepID=UPI001F0F6F67|nr:M20/M25/M40 family metallo-hydrolase [Acidaminobacter sp. JC074]MCH4886440.1 M20 family metallopeptidase [Acidaminobacter sp. JC074]
MTNICGGISDFMMDREKDFLEDLSGLIAINTEASDDLKPFGKGVRSGFDYLIEIARKYGLNYKDVDGYAIHIDYGTGPLIGLLCHVDTVGIYEPDKWLTAPFEMTLKDQVLYGRGVNDNKGPLMACLYLLIYLKSNNIQLNNTIRLIVGGAEETTWEGIKYYFEKEEMPEIGISPDGNFPIVNIEKGVRYLRLTGNEDACLDSIKSTGDKSKVCSKVILKDFDGETCYYGISAPSRHPTRGVNAIIKMCETYKNPLEIFEKMKHFYKKMNKGDFTCNYSSFNYSGNTWTLDLDIRWVHDILEKEVDDLVAEYFNASVEVLKESKDRLYVPPKDPFIGILKRAYKEVFNKEAELVTKGGASYARVLKKGVAFGPCQEGQVPNQHQPNENQSLEGLYKSQEVYMAFLKECGAFYETKNYGNHQNIIRK